MELAMVCLTSGQLSQLFTLLGEIEQVLRSTQFQVWKTITLGHYTSPYQYRKALKQVKRKRGIPVIHGEEHEKLLDATICSQEEIEVDLVRLTVQELGFKDGATIRDIIERGRKLGLEVCPAEVGPALRLAYLDQPEGESHLRIAMEPIDEMIYEVEYLNDMYLMRSGARPDRIYHDHTFVFVRPRR